MKPLSTVIILSLLAGALVSGPSVIRAQQSPVSDQQLGERLLDAVDGNDVKTVRSILAIASGRALVASPIGLRAAGRAVERGNYEIAHQILAVRTQRIQLEKQVGAGNPPTKPVTGATKTRQSASPADQLRPKSPPTGLGSQIPGPLGVIVPKPATRPKPEAAARTGAPNFEPAPALIGPNPFDPSYTPQVELPRVVPVGQPDNRSDRLGTFPVARIATPPDLPIRGLLKNTETDTAPVRNLPTPIDALSGAPESENEGILSRLLDTVSDTFNPFHSKPMTGRKNRSTQETVRSPNLSSMSEEPLTVPSLKSPTPDMSSLTEDKPPSDGFLSSWKRFISVNDPLENPDPPANLTPEPTTSASGVNAKDVLSREDESNEPGKSTSPPQNVLPSEPGELDLIDLIKKVLRLDITQPKLATEQTSASPPTAAKPLDNSPRGPSEITNFTHLQNEQASTSKARLANPLPNEPSASEIKKIASADHKHSASLSSVDGTTLPNHIGAELKSNSFHEKTVTLPSHPAPATSQGTTMLPGKNAMRHPRKRAVAIRSGSTRNERAAIVTERAQNPGARRKTQRPRAKADASGDARETLPIFRIGNSLALGRSLNPKALANGQCLQKERNAGWFCLEHADWPAQMAREIGKSIDRTRGAATIVQYKNGRAVRIYSSIPSDSYEGAVKYYSDLIGPATKITRYKLPRLGKTTLSNPSSNWINTSTSDGKEILEIRKFDNIRGLMASETSGLIRLFKENSNPIFSALSDTDLILHQLRAKNMKR